MSEVTVGREKLECHPSVNLGTVYPQVVVVNSLISQDAVWQGQIQWAPACPHLPLISHHLQRKSSQFMCQQHLVLHAREI